MWFQSVNVLDLAFKGILVGVIASGLMGPVGVLCIQRTLNKGRWYGFVTGIGAAVSDIIYALITGFGMSFGMDIITNERNLFYLKLAGSFMLLLFGIYSYRSNPAKNYHPVSHNKGTLVHNGVTGFLVTFSNPVIIFLFMALFAQFAFVVPNHPFEKCVGYLSILAGALLWWLGLTYLINKVRNRFDSRGLLLIGRVVGIIVILASVVVFIGTVTNLYSLDY